MEILKYGKEKIPLLWRAVGFFLFGNCRITYEDRGP